MTDVPPPVPASSNEPAPPPRRGLSTGAIVAIVIAAIALVTAIPCIAGLVGTVAVVVPQMHEKQARFQCANNLSQLGSLYIVSGTNDPAWKPRSGPALFLEWRKSRTMLREGQEAILVCPGDATIPAPDSPESRARYDDVDLRNIPDDLSSYAVRDFARFPIESASSAPEPIAACIHHRGGANVLYDDGSTQFLQFFELGISSAAELVVGPTSKSPILRVMTLGPGAPK